MNLRYVIITQGRVVGAQNNIRRYNYDSIAAATTQFTRLATNPALHKVELLAVLECMEVER